VQARGVLSNHTSNLTSSQSLGVSLLESSSRMERSVGVNGLEAWLVGEWERVSERGWRGIYTPTPKSDRCVFSGGSRIIRGNPIIRGVDRIGYTHWNSQVRIIRCRAGSSGLGSSRRSQVTRSGSSGLVQYWNSLCGRIIRPKVGSSGLVQKLCAGEFCGCFLSKISSQTKHFNNQKFVRMRSLDSTVILYSNSNRKLKLNLR